MARSSGPCASANPTRAPAAAGDRDPHGSSFPGQQQRHELTAAPPRPARPTEAEGVSGWFGLKVRDNAAICQMAAPHAVERARPWVGWTRESARRQRRPRDHEQHRAPSPVPRAEQRLQDGARSRACRPRRRRPRCPGHCARSGEAARAVAVIASDDPVQAMPTPTNVCTATNIQTPVAAVMIAIAANTRSPNTMTGRNPQRSATAPSGA
jgi:hypothetical protein